MKVVSSFFLSAVYNNRYNKLINPYNSYSHNEIWKYLICAFAPKDIKVFSFSHTVLQNIFWAANNFTFRAYFFEQHDNLI